MSKIVLGQKPFFSVQGEGERLGMLTMFVRFFGCTLNCNGFGQANPADPSTHILDHLEKNKYTSLAEVPVFIRGCDSSYSWSKNFKHLAVRYPTADEVLLDIIHEGEFFGTDLRENWVHTQSGLDIQLCFTGGEPMLYQNEMISIAEQARGLSKITIETNGTREMSERFISKFISKYDVVIACSPKLLNVSGEKDAVNLEIISQYVENSPKGILKFVMNNRNDAWKELDEYLPKLKEIVEKNSGWSIWVMPVGADEYAQNEDSVKLVAERALYRGLYLTPRAHVGFFGNALDK